jgi:hypothetical protein
MKCTVCGTSVDAIEDIVDKGWIFSFFDGEDEHGPLCQDCSEFLLSKADDGEYEVKEEYRGKIVYDDQLDDDDEEDPMDQLVLGFILN